MNQDEYEKQRKYGLSVVKCHLMSPPPKKIPKLVMLFFGGFCAVYNPKRAHISFTLWQKPEFSELVYLACRTLL